MPGLGMPFLPKAMVSSTDSSYLRKFHDYTTLRLPNLGRRSPHHVIFLQDRMSKMGNSLDVQTLQMLRIQSRCSEMLLKNQTSEVPGAALKFSTSDLAYHTPSHRKLGEARRILCAKFPALS